MGADLLQFRRDLGLTQKQMAKRLRTSASDYEILESFWSLVPDPLPPHITDRLNAIELECMAAGQITTMPKVRCPLHECRLKQHRKRWLWRLRGKMRRWWAVCPIGGELYTVRSDGLVQIGPRWKPRSQVRRRRTKGRPASKRRLFVEAKRLHGSRRKPTWREITMKLIPKEFAEDPKAATERLRIGVLNLKKRLESTEFK